MKLLDKSMAESLHSIDAANYFHLFLEWNFQYKNNELIANILGSKLVVKFVHLNVAPFGIIYTFVNR